MASLPCTMASLAESSANQSAVIHAAWTEDWELMKKMLRMIFTVLKNHGKVVKLFLNAAAGIQTNKANKNAETPLFLAVEEGRLSMVRLLIEQKDTDINQARTEDGRTPLIIAAARGHNKMVQLLLEREDIKVNKEDKTGATSLLLAAEKGHDNVVKLLLEREDIQVNKGDKHGYTPLYVAAHNGHSTVVQLLLEREEIKVLRFLRYSLIFRKHNDFLLLNRIKMFFKTRRSITKS